jgi:hypothetical protein
VAVLLNFFLSLSLFYRNTWNKVCLSAAVQRGQNVKLLIVLRLVDSFVQQRMQVNILEWLLRHHNPTPFQTTGSHHETNAVSIIISLHFFTAIYEFETRNQPALPDSSSDSLFF